MDTRFDRMARVLKDHGVVAVVLMIGVGIVAVASVTNAAEHLVGNVRDAGHGIRSLVKQDPAGTIRSPASGSLVRESLEVSGTLSGIPEELHPWIATRFGTRLWPKEPLPDNASWRVTIHEPGGAGSAFDIVLLLVDGRTDSTINTWLDRGTRSGVYPGIPTSAGMQFLDSVSVSLERH